MGASVTCHRGRVAARLTVDHCPYNTDSLKIVSDGTVCIRAFYDQCI